MRKVNGQQTSGLFEEFRELLMDYEDITKLVNKLESYRDYSEGQEGGSQADYNEIHAIVGEVREDEDGTDARTPLLKNTDQMGAELAFYLRKTQEIGVLFSAALGYILPTTLPPADLRSVAHQSVEVMLGRGILLTLDDDPIALINSDRIEYFLEHNEANALDVIANINKRQPEPSIPAHLQSFLDEQRREERYQEYDELYDAACKELQALLIEKFGSALENCEFTECDAIVKQIVSSRIAAAG